MKGWRRGAGAPSGLPPGLPGLPDEPADAFDDTERVLRYLAKCTLEPAIVHGIAGDVGSLQPGRLADIVLWRPAFFGVKPELVLKAGHMAWGALGEGNSTIEWSEPTRYRPHWGAAGTAYTYRDANADAGHLLSTWLQMARATNLEELKNVFRNCGSTLWVNTTYADDKGNAYYIDNSSVPCRWSRSASYRPSPRTTRYRRGWRTRSSVEP